MTKLIKKKIKLVYYDLEGKLATENVWAIQDGEFYRIKNIPFFASNIAYDDLIGVEDDEGEFFFEDKIQESGNSTIQIIIFDDNNLTIVTREFESLSCGWEGSHLKQYISINVPRNVNYTKIKEFLNQGRVEKIFDYKEACLSEIHYSQ